MQVKQIPLILLIMMWTMNIVTARTFDMFGRKPVGSPCRMENSRKSPGVCKDLSKCKVAIGNIHAGINPTICSILPGRIIVCCRTKSRISRKKCEEYKRVLRNTTLRSSFSPVSTLTCDVHTSTRITGGKDAEEGEFPHQVAIGYGRAADGITWRCGGTLISREYILTAAHCLKDTTNVGPPTKILLGDIRLHGRENSSSSRVEVSVAKLIIHPDYYPPLNYNDIALIKLQHRINISRSIFPACIPQPEDRLDKKLYFQATGFGQLGAFESQSDVLQDVYLKRFQHNDCNNYFNESLDRATRFPEGIIRSQLCAGDKKDSKDTCKGDSGGPLTVHKDELCVYYVVGVTSFGSNLCGLQQPGVYTNVQSYLDWIEDIVWPLKRSVIKVSKNHTTEKVTQTSMNTTGITTENTTPKIPEGAIQIILFKNITLTPASITQTTPASITQTTPASITQTTPASITLTTPAGITHRTSKGTARTTPAGITQRTSKGTARTTPAGITLTTPAGVTQRTSKGTTETTPSGITRKTSTGTTRTTQAGIADIYYTTSASTSRTTPAKILGTHPPYSPYQKNHSSTKTASSEHNSILKISSTKKPTVEPKITSSDNSEEVEKAVDFATLRINEQIKIILSGIKI